MLGVDFKCFLADHKAGHGVITQSLCFHDALHVGSPTKFTSDQTARRVNDSVRKKNFLNLVTQNILDLFGESFELSLFLFCSFLLFFGLSKVQSFLCGTYKFFTIIFLELLNGVLVNWVSHVKYFKTTHLQSFKEGRFLNSFFASAGDVVNHLLIFLHASNIFLKRCELSGLGREVTEEFSEFGTVGGVLMNTQFKLL